VVDLLAGTATDGFGGQDSISGFEMVRGTLFNDSIKGGASDERFRALGGSDTIDGGGGSDTVDYSRDNTRGGNAGVQVLLGIGTGIDGFGAQDTLVSIENARGTGRADTLLGNGADNRLEGLAGDDTLGVGGGNDSVDGGEGLDTAEFAFGFEDYTGTLLAGGAIRLEDRTPGRDGIITASNVEVFSFADRTLTAAQLTASLTNNAPTGVALESATTSVLENTNTGAALVLGTLVVTDDGRGTNTLSLGGADAAFFETVGTQLRLKAGTVLDFETKASYAVTVGVDDPSVGTAPDASTTYTLSVGDVNEAPTEVHLSGSVAENQAGVLVGSLEASDADAGEAVAFSVSDSRFEVRNGNELWLKAGQSLDFEQAAGILLPVTATDSGGLSVTQAVTVSVTDVNEAPTSVSLVSATTSLAETASTINAVVLADLSVSDDALGTNVLSVTGADAAFFEIVGGQLRLKAGTALNFETRSSYTVTVNVDDASLGGAPDAVSSYTLTVTDVNEAPTAIATTDTVASLPASTGMGSAVRVADLVVTDDGLGTNAFGLSGADAASFEVVGSSLFLKAGTVLDAAAKPAYAVTVTVDDATTGGSPDATVAFNLAVTGSSAGAIAINNAPVIVSNGGGATGALPVLSGTTAVTTVHATDADAGAALVYSLAGGADQSLFQIDPSTGVLRFVGAPNFATPADAGANNVYDVVVRVSDGALVDEQAIAVTVDPAQGLVPGIGGQAGFGTDALPRNDDSVTSQLAIGSVFENGLNFFGNVFSALFISNNGRVTFNSPDGSFTPQAITGATNNAQIGVFFADVDTRGGSTTASPGGQSTGSNLVYYAFDVPNDRIVITWDDVGYYSNHVDKVNSFQLILTDRSSTGQAGDFDITFRYEAINWTTGDASQGSNGFGGIVARAGYSAGTGVAGTYFELPTSGNQQAMLDLDASAGNTGLAGIWEFQVRNGVVDAPPSLTLGSATATLVEATAYDAGTDTSSIALTILDDNDLGSYVTTGWTQLTATTFRKAGLYGAAVLDTVANTVTYTLDNADPDTDALATGTTAHDLFSLSVTDGFSTVSRDIDFAITGRNETLASGPAPGTTGDDTLSGIGGDFSLAGVAGNDSYIVDSAGDLVIETAGNGSDTVFVRTVASYTMSGNVEVAVLQSGTAAIVDNGADNSIFGNGLDNDVTLNQGGDDTVVAGGGNDTVSASAGSNALFGNEGADSLLGGSGDDRLIGGTGADVALGSGGNDTLWGEDGADSLSGDDGNDVIVGGTGDDTMDGGAGNDSYEVDSLFDLIMPDSEGTDTVHVSYDGFVLDAARGDLEVIVFEAGVVNGSGNDFSNTLFGNAGANTLLAGGGNDTVVAGEGADSASGGDDQDQLFGQGGSDTLDGGNGFDQLIGGTGDDRLVGGAGADTLWGEDGNDSLEGGPGDDHLLGGAGQDHFIISIGDGVDTIYDYNAAQDTIDVLAPAGSWSVVAGGGFYSVLDSGGAVFLQVVGSDPPLLT
jgi:VCBS repeat-containing protein